MLKQIRIINTVISGQFSREGPPSRWIIDTGISEWEPVQIRNQFYQQEIFEYLSTDIIWENNFY
jgi:hypothetical protein